MTDGEKVILAELRAMRAESNSNFKEVRKNIADAHKRIDETDDKVANNSKDIAVAKTKTGILATVLTLIFTTIGTIISSWFNNKPH